MTDQSPTQRMPFYKKTWFSISVIVVALFIAIGIIYGYHNNSYSRQQKAEMVQTLEQGQEVQQKLQQQIDGYK